MTYASGPKKSSFLEVPDRKAHPIVNTPQTSSLRKARQALRLLLVAGLALSLSGCIIAMPTAFKFISIAADGFSLLATGKTTTDHAISQVIGKDCAMTGALKNEDVCTENKSALELNGEDVADHPKAYTSPRD